MSEYEYLLFMGTSEKNSLTGEANHSAWVTLQLHNHAMPRSTVCVIHMSGIVLVQSHVTSKHFLQPVVAGYFGFNR